MIGNSSLTLAIRQFTPDDALRVHELATEVVGSRWSLVDFQTLATRPHEHIRVLVRAPSERVEAFLHWSHVADEIEILNIATDPAVRRHGCARELLRHLAEYCAQCGVRAVFLEVRESNRAARALYAAAGFELAACRVAYYRDPVEDALVLRRLCASAAR